MLNIVVTDDLVEKVVKTIIKVNQTGSPGDGKIFIEKLVDAIRVRTGETGDAAICEDIKITANEVSDGNEI